ncbi:MAG: hypothetical protein EZS28_013081 [Streblomastix strix]|uniref:Uncharacterized protein n=1 Tax=Streblomastix strix TaxID=222440 RepID=A0A5J4W8Z6_9EUKA|nr:MAG: hypothetical protein EZS28_013081 [Streblomastix strix]
MKTDELQDVYQEVNDGFTIPGDGDGFYGDIVGNAYQTLLIFNAFYYIEEYLGEEGETTLSGVVDIQLLDQDYGVNSIGDLDTMEFGGIIQLNQFDGTEFVVFVFVFTLKSSFDEFQFQVSIGEILSFYVELEDEDDYDANTQLFDVPNSGNTYILFIFGFKGGEFNFQLRCFQGDTCVFSFGDQLFNVFDDIVLQLNKLEQIDPDYADVVRDEYIVFPLWFIG